MKTRFSIIIVSLNGRARIDMPLARLVDAPAHGDEVIVVDNGSTDGLATHVAANHPWVRLVRAPRNLGFAGGNNAGMRAARGEFLLLLNDDTEPEPGWLEPLHDAFYRNPRLGLAGCQLLYPGPDRRVQHLGGIVHPNGLTDHVGWGDAELTGDESLIEADYVTGAAMAIRRAVVEDVGLLDPGFWPIYFEEVDFCARARRRGWECATVPASRVVHHESQTTVRLSRGFLEKYHRNRVRFLIKNRTMLEWPGALWAEARWWVRHRPWDCLWPCALAYAWAPVHAIELMVRGGRGGG